VIAICAKELVTKEQSIPIVCENGDGLLFQLLREMGGSKRGRWIVFGNVKNLEQAR